MDNGYDNNRVVAETTERGCVPIVSLRKGRAIPLLPISYGSDEWKRLYRGRSAVEREFGRLSALPRKSLRYRGRSPSVAQFGREREPEARGEQAKVLAVRVGESVAQMVAELKLRGGAADRAPGDLAAASEPVGRIEAPAPIG
jgi:hypothetical protein